MAREIEDVREFPGAGLEAQVNGETARLGSRRWCGVTGEASELASGLAETVFRLGSGEAVIFRFEDMLRPAVAEAIAAIKAMGLEVEILSGDRRAAVAPVAQAVGIGTWRAELMPQDKLAHVAALIARGRRPVMVGDGLNDAPALAAGFTSIAPASASDVGRTAADTVFMGDALTPLVDAITVARRSQALARQNFALAILYNVLAVPVAMAGLASPLIAAVAMSTSSIIVIGNALRLGVGRRARISSAPASRAQTPESVREAA
jgi:Cu2+-exporting ATPase